MVDRFEMTFGSGFPAGLSRVPTATLRLRGDVCPMSVAPQSNSVQGTSLPIATRITDPAFAATGVKRPYMHPPGSTRTDHDG